MCASLCPALQVRQHNHCRPPGGSCTATSVSVQFSSRPVAYHASPATGTGIGSAASPATEAGGEGGALLAVDADSEAGWPPLLLPPPTLLAGGALPAPLLSASRLRVGAEAEPLPTPSTECALLLPVSRVVRVPASEQVGEPGKLHTAVGVAV